MRYNGTIRPGLSSCLSLCVYPYPYRKQGLFSLFTDWFAHMVTFVFVSTGHEPLDRLFRKIDRKHKARIKLISLPLSPFSQLKKHLNPTCQFLYFSLFCTHLNNKKCKLLFQQLEIALQTIKTTPLKGRKTNSQTQTQRTLCLLNLTQFYFCMPHAVKHEDWS